MKKKLNIVFITLGVLLAIFSITFIIYNHINNQMVKVTVFDGSKLLKEFNVKRNTLVMDLEVPIKDNYNFLYYTYNGNILDVKTKIKSDMKINAVFENEIIDTSKEYTVIFDSKGGSIIESVLVQDGQQVGYPESPTKDGYIFKGWLLNGETFDFSSPITSDIVLIADYEEKTASVETIVVKFDTQGGSSVNSIKIVKNNVINKPNNPCKNGYTFVEWQLNGKKFNFSTRVNENITLNAVWKKNNLENTLNNYMISFDSKGGNSIGSQIIKEGGLVIRPSNPVKNGYTFVEWQLNGKRYDFASKVSSNFTLVAYWQKQIEVKEETFTVTFDSNGGSSVKSQVIKKGNNINVPVNPTKKGYSFIEWQLNGKKYDFNMNVTSNMTLRAKWSNDTWDVSNDGSVIKYKGNQVSVTIPKEIDGIKITNVKNGTFTSEITEYVILADSIISVDGGTFSRSNVPRLQKLFVTETQFKNFDNWLNIFKSNTLCHHYSNTGSFAKATIDGCETWTRSIENKDEHYFIGFAPGSCPIRNPNQNYYLTKEDTPLFDLSFTGYTFDGWTGNGINIPTKNIIIPKGTTGNLGYTSHCTEFTWKIKLDYNRYFDLDYSQVDYNKEPYCGNFNSSCTYRYSQSVTIPENQVIRKGYDFDGWAVYSDGPIKYRPGEVVKELFDKDKSILVLYPVWKKNKN